MSTIPSLATLTLIEMGEVIRLAATTGCQVDFTKHGKDRMAQRGVSADDVFNVLRNGTVRKAESSRFGIHATMQHLIGGRALNVSIAINIQQDGLVVITVFWKKKVTP